MFRRDFKLFIKCILSASVILLVLAAVSAVAAGAVIHGVGDVYTPIKVAVCDNEDSVYSRILINAVKKVDYISDLLDVEKMDADEAEAAIARGECSAAIILPDGFIDDVLSGRVSGGRIIVSSELSAHSEIVAAVAGYGEEILGAGQFGTFTGLDLIKLHGLSSDVRRDYLDRVNIALLEEAIGARERYFSLEILEYYDTGMSMTAYYVLCWLILFLFLCSVFFVPLYTTDINRSMLNRLRSVGVGYGRFFLPKLMYTFFFRFLILLSVFAVTGELLGTEIGFDSVLYGLITSLYITVIGMAITVTVGDGITGNIIVAVGGMLFCGGIVPRQMLPKAILAVGDASPFGAAKALFAPAFGADADAFGIALAVFYASVAVYLIWLHTAAVTAGRR